MKNTQPPRFDMTAIIEKARRMANRHLDGVSINLPFVSLTIKPDDTERRIANEIAIRLADRRILNASECCDNCIDQALNSLQGIREIIVDKQVELYSAKESALYLILEMMAEALRQFLTFEQNLNKLHREPMEVGHPDFHRSPEARKAYFIALEALRGHFSRCLLEVSKIGDVTLPKIEMITRYQSPWPLDAYVPPKPPVS